MNQAFRPLTCVLSVLVLAGLSDGALARHKPNQTSKVAHSERHRQHHKIVRSAHRKGAAPAKQAGGKDSPSTDRPAEAATAPSLTGDAAVVKQAFDLVRQGKTGEATATEKLIGDPAAQKLVEWFILRHPEAEDVGFARYAAFLRDNSDWPSMRLLRRRAEARLWNERADAATVRQFINDRPLSAKGRFALARALLAAGDGDGAARQVRAAWRTEELSEASETDALAMFSDILTPADHRARMDKRIGAKEFSAALRAARRVGADDAAIVKACVAVSADSKKALDLLDDVATEQRQDLGYVLCRVQWLMRRDRMEEAARIVIAAPGSTMASQDTDEWWRVRRVLARKLLDQGQFQSAYDVTQGAAPPANENYRAESHFLPGWIALRFLNNPAKALAHFAHVDEGCVNPIVRARANYWRARAAEALDDGAATLTYYAAAAGYPTAYYGQLARRRLGLGSMVLRVALGDVAPSVTAGSAEIVRAADMLYSIGERDIVLRFVTDLAEENRDVATLTAVAELAGRRNDARAMLQIGKAALGHGLRLDRYAFPTIGIPPHSPIGPEIDRSIIYSVARTESGFDQRDKSAANAVGLMQVTPEAGRDTAKRFGVSYDWDRMVSDPVYNTQMGAAEIGALLRDYNGSHIMTFAGYNAGRGRVRDWVKQYGDPRDPKVDPVDWVERIPFAETRNYVQRVMENLEVYRLRFGPGEGGAPLISRLDQPGLTGRVGSELPSTAAAAGPE